LENPLVIAEQQMMVMCMTSVDQTSAQLAMGMANLPSHGNQGNHAHVCVMNFTPVQHVQTCTLMALTVFGQRSITKCGMLMNVAITQLRPDINRIAVGLLFTFTGRMATTLTP